MIRNFLYSTLSNISELLLHNMVSYYFVVKKESGFQGSSFQRQHFSDSGAEADLGKKLTWIWTAASLYRLDFTSLLYSQENREFNSFKNFWYLP